MTIKRTITALLLILALATVGSSSTAAAHAGKDPCANRLCTKYKPGTPSCFRFHGYAKVQKCFIVRAARHYHQSVRQALYVSWRESRFKWWINNTDRPCEGSNYAKGPFQFCKRLWHFSVYGKRGYDPHNPKIAPLAAMRLWAGGCAHHWQIAVAHITRRIKGC